ncbi:acyl-CoA dehydrogenase family protein [Nocardioides pacificus]
MTSDNAQELEELRAVTRRFCEEKSPSEAVRALAASGAGRDDAVWTQLAGQLGLTGLAIPEEYGGAGLGPVELGIVMEEMGRTLMVSPFLGTVALAGQALAACEDGEARAAWLPGIAAGSVTAALAVADFSGDLDPDGVRTVAVRDGDGWVLSGTKRFVIDGDTADILVVAARVDDELAVFVVAAAASGMERAHLPALDTTRRLATVTLAETPAVRLAGDGAALLDRTRDLALAAVAAEQLGGASKVLEMTVDYLKVREQFGRPIGSFQALKHRCADLAIEIESGRSATTFAASLLAGHDPEGPIAAAGAKSWCSTAFTHAAKEAVQMHGGIGYTWEHDAHLYLKRAKSSELLLGSPARHRARVAELTGIC